MISDGIDGSATSYTINCLDSISGDLCSSVTIPASLCAERICNHTFEISTSSCPPCVDINITVYATNILGNGAISDPLTIGCFKWNIKFHIYSHCIVNFQRIQIGLSMLSLIYSLRQYTVYSNNKH